MGHVRFGGLVCLVVMVLSAGSAWAEDAEDTGPSGMHSVNLSPLGLVLGAVALNYELLLDKQHGLLIEGQYRQSSGDDGEEASLMGGVLGYRWHWGKSQDSGFVGLNFGYQTGEGFSKINDVSYKQNLTETSLTLNGGARYAWKNGFNITWRLGGGYASREVTAAEPGEDAESAAELVDAIFDFIPIAVDAELSVGWVF